MKRELKDIRLHLRARLAQRFTHHPDEEGTERGDPPGGPDFSI